MGRKKRQPDEQQPVIESTAGGGLTATPNSISSSTTTDTSGDPRDGVNSMTATGGPAVKRRKNAKQDKNNDGSRQSSVVQQGGAMPDGNGSTAKFEYKQDMSIKAEPPGPWGNPAGIPGPPPGSMGPPYRQYFPPPHTMSGLPHYLPPHLSQQSDLPPNYANHGNPNNNGMLSGNASLPPMMYGTLPTTMPSNMMRHCGPLPGHMMVPSAAGGAPSEMSPRGVGMPPMSPHALAATGPGQPRHHLPSKHPNSGPDDSPFLPPLMLPSGNSLPRTRASIGDDANASYNRCAPPPDKHAAAAGIPATHLGLSPHDFTSTGGDGLPSLPPPAPLHGNLRTMQNPPGGGPIMLPPPPNAAPQNADRLWICRGCRQPIFNEDAIVCEANCHQWFHRQCSGLTPFAFRCVTEEPYAVWVCDICISTEPNSIPMVMLGSSFQ